MKQKPFVFVVQPLRDGDHFPLDMLRYDSAWPAGQRDVEMLKGPVPATESVMLATFYRPTKDRWLSFGWRVVY